MMQPTEIPKGKPFTLAGTEYEIKEGLLNAAHSKNVLRFEDLTPFGEPSEKFWHYRLDEKHVLYHRKRYPVFDSYDSMYENRYFRVFYLCSSRAEMQQKYDFLTSGNLFIANENPAERYRRPLLPYVYADDGKENIEVYEESHKAGMFSRILRMVATVFRRRTS